MRLHDVRTAMRLLPLIALAPLALAYPPTVSAAEGETTPGLSVSVLGVATHGGESPLTLRLTAHSEQITLGEPGSCRPKDQNMRCWGSLRLVVHDMGGMRIDHLDVHRVAVVGEGDHGEEHGEDHGEDHGDAHENATAATAALDAPQRIQVSGVAVIKRPGTSGFAQGTLVQATIMLVDNGKQRYGDTADVTVNEFVEGPTKPLIYQSGPVAVQQVRADQLAGRD